MKVAVTVIGWIATGTLGAWLARAMLTPPPDADSRALTVVVGSLLMLTWAAGSILAWKRPGLAILCFGVAAALPFSPEHMLPRPSLLVAISAALALWTLLAGLGTSLAAYRRARERRAAQRMVNAARADGLQVCVICHEPVEGMLCGPCATALGPHAHAWLHEEGTTTPPTRPPARHTARNGPATSSPAPHEEDTASQRAGGSREATLQEVRVE